MRKSNATLLGEIYDHALVMARSAAHGCGYALAIHGSEMRDLDLIAVPWKAEAEDGDALIAAILRTTGGTLNGPPTIQPHGRRSFSICVGDVVLGNFKPLRPYLDVSVAPWIAKPEETG